MQTKRNHRNLRYDPLTAARTEADGDPFGRRMSLMQPTTLSATQTMRCGAVELIQVGIEICRTLALSSQDSNHHDIFGNPEPLHATVDPKYMSFYT